MDATIDLSEVNTDHLGRILAVLRQHGVTRAKFGAVELEVTLVSESGPTTFADIDRANESDPPPFRTIQEVRFPGRIAK